MSWKDENAESVLGGFALGCSDPHCFKGAGEQACNRRAFGMKGLAGAGDGGLVL